MSEAHPSLLRFITCGSVDDGKSSLIGRLLYESQLIPDDHLAAVVADSKTVGTRGGEIDLALLVDGLAAEREQRITIDVAYRFFSTPARTFIVADAPGHEEYTRNMVTGASTADLAVLLIDARKGVLTQTRRHGYLLSLLGVKQVVLAVNKMDLVEYSARAFRDITDDFQGFAAKIGLHDVRAIPVAAVLGDNVVATSQRMPWYMGPTLMHVLETIDITERMTPHPFRMPIQWVNRPNQDFRGFAGLIASGEIRPGDRIRVMPSGRSAEVSRLVTADGDLQRAVAGQSITVTLTSEIDVSRGDVLADAAVPPAVANQFEATLIWLQDAPMLQGRTYTMKIGTRSVPATVAPLKYRVNVNSLEHVAAETLEMNEIGVVELVLDQPIAFAPYTECRTLGGFILIDRLTNETVCAGLLHFALRRADNVRWQHLDVSKATRSHQKGQKACVVWLTGLSGAGKTTIANLVETRLLAMGRHTYLLDGDNVRHGLNKDLGFTSQDRVENIRRVAEVARLMVDAGLIVLAAFISPFRAERLMARQLLEPGEFIEVFVDVPLAVAEQRDTKGLYAKARRGQLANFTGVDSPYEPPDHPEMRIDTTHVTPNEAADAIIHQLFR